ncbi:transcriptional regulator, Crp/Fnr family protein [Gloeomargarita lithophora Alchichica-D10]|uniref:Transcriptional regulator, Crp/Fnr family protein n=1 Tax=Gloeomargarita lithophora Alchichica-D10 TaxID=1188229 RepID=A0A1J0AAM9_9CYAN|nr:Crp/Fnr family transcriptional regulator [Gloeomargarita lithophora]APB32965.1 transcriptional regulator, Crp/Fnr family protein [Gloeomargarita lithophora Alchichica-D10]
MTVTMRQESGVFALEMSWRELVGSHLELTGKLRQGRFFPRHELLPLEGDGLWQVGQGVVQLSTAQSNGDEVLVGLAGPGMPLGMPLTGLVSYQARALTDVYCLWLSLAELERSGALAQVLLFQLMRRLRQTEALLAITAGQRRVEDRLRHLLLLLAQEVGEPVPTGVRLAVRLTHQSLANAIGTSRVTCTRLLGRFQTWGWVAWGADRHLLVTQTMPGAREERRAS